MKSRLKQMALRMFSLFPLKKRVILESHPDYSGNTFQVFEKMLENGLNNEYELVWNVENPEKFGHIQIKNVKFEKIMPDSIFERIIQVIHRAGAMLLVYENKSLTKINLKSKTIFLNHGTLLKNTKSIYAPNQNVDYVITASENIDHLYREMYNLTDMPLYALGYPRNDLLFTQERFNWKTVFDDYNNEKIIIWMPTFRQHKSGERNDLKDPDNYLPLGLPIIYNLEILAELNDFLKENNIYLVLKSHYAQDLDFITVNDLTNFKLLSDEDLFDLNTSLYEVLSSTDALLTDYSSIYFDYLLLNKPIGLTNDDIDQYKLGFVYDDIDKVLVAEKISNLEMLKSFINNVANGEDIMMEQRQSVNNYFNKYQDGKSAERIYDLAIKVLKE